MRTPNNGNGNGCADRLDVHPQLIVAIGTQAEIMLRCLLERIRAFFGFLPPYIEAIALDSTGQVSCGAPLLPGRRYLNFAQPSAEHILRHMAEYPHLQRWFPSGCQKLTVGNGAGGERAVGMLYFVSALPLITRVLTERLARFRPDAFADVAAECNRDRRLIAKGITVSGDTLDAWIVTTSVGGTCAATLALGTLISKLASVEGVRLTQNALMLFPEIAEAEGMSFTERHKRANSYAACAEFYSALACRPFAIETMAGTLEQEGQLFQTVLIGEPATGRLEHLTRHLGADLLFHLTTGAVGTQYHRRAIDLQGRVFSQNGPYSQKRVFSAAGSATLFAAPENVQALAEQILLCGVLQDLSLDAATAPISGDQIDLVGVSFAKLYDFQPSLPPLQPRRMSVAAVEKAIIAQTPIIAAELKRTIDTARAEVKQRLEAGRQELYRDLRQTLRSKGCRALTKQCEQILTRLEEEKMTIVAARLRLAQQEREGIKSSGTPQQRLDLHNRRYLLAVEGQFLGALELEYKRLVEWFARCLSNARTLLEHVERLCRQHENLLETESARAVVTRPHRILDTQSIAGLLKDQRQALLDKAVRLMEQALEQGELQEGQIQELSAYAATTATDRLKPYRSVRAALSLVDEAEQQKLLGQVFQAAQPSLRLYADYIDREEHVLVSLSEGDTDLLAVIGTFTPRVICSQEWREDAVVIVRVWHGIEPSAMPSVHEARAAYARQADLLSQGADGAPREVIPFVDRRFQAPCLVMPSGVRREALLLIPLSRQIKGPIQFDPERCCYVYRNGSQPLDLGPTRQQAFDNLMREENRHPHLPPLEELVAWSRAEFEALGADKTIEMLEQMIDTQDEYLADLDLVMDRLILQEERAALDSCCRERRNSLRRYTALAKANGNHA